VALQGSVLGLSASGTRVWHPPGLPEAP